MSIDRRKRTVLGRSFDVYYRDHARTARMDALNAQFVRQGSLAFDIGAHVGDRTGSFLRLGARVVALEPQPLVFRALRLIYGSSKDVHLICAAVGAEDGMLDLHINHANPTISTASPAFIDAARDAEMWQGQTWDDVISVPVTTLDRLIAQNGVPDFVKIDVEGNEHQVLEGLSLPLPALSFEFTTIQREVAYACLTRLTALGSYRFNVSLGEDHHLQSGNWMTVDELRRFVENLPEDANSGDVLAVMHSS